MTNLKQRDEKRRVRSVAIFLSLSLSLTQKRCETFIDAWKAFLMTDDQTNGDRIFIRIHLDFVASVLCVSTKIISKCVNDEIIFLRVVIIIIINSSSISCSFSCTTRKRLVAMKSKEKTTQRNFVGECETANRLNRSTFFTRWMSASFSRPLPFFGVSFLFSSRQRTKGISTINERKNERIVDVNWKMSSSSNYCWIVFDLAGDIFFVFFHHQDKSFSSSHLISV